VDECKPAPAKWQPIVKTNREKPTLEFGKERDKMQRKETLAGRCRLSIPSAWSAL